MAGPAGPQSPNHAVGTDGSPYTQADPDQLIRSEPTYPAPPGEPAPPSVAYPGLLPPAASYPKRQRRRLIIAALVVFVLLAVTITAIVYGARDSGSTAAGISDASAKTAIQGYLEALEHRDVNTVVRNALCGLYDAVRDRRPDEALAKLSSDAFRKQFTHADVTSIDKIVYLSQYQAQVLFTMRVVLASGGPPRDQVQGTAELLLQRNQVLVCSYGLRAAGTY